MLHVTPVHSFPASQVTASAGKRRREYLRWAEERGGYIVETTSIRNSAVSSKGEDTLFALEPSAPVIYMEYVLQDRRARQCVVLPPRSERVFQARWDSIPAPCRVFGRHRCCRAHRQRDFERHISHMRHPDGGKQKSGGKAAAFKV